MKVWRFAAASWVVMAVGSMLASGARADIKLPALLSDNMVLQRNATVKLWGTASPGEPVSITASWGAAAHAVAGVDGGWIAAIPTAHAGGPYTIIFRGADSVTLHNVMLGEVWLCSGQSNMELTVHKGWAPPLQDEAHEIATANWPQIRMFNVVKNTSSVPLRDCRGAWQVCSPQTVGDFSAVGYFFARALYQRLVGAAKQHIPIGMIHSSWGGTEIELWMSEPSLQAVPGFAQRIERYQQAQVQGRAMLAAWQQGLAAADAGWNHWNAPQLRTDGWRSAGVLGWPKPAEGRFSGIVWFRTEFQLPSGSGSAALSLGRVSGSDSVWVDGRQLRAANGTGEVQRFALNGPVATPGPHTVAVRIQSDNSSGVVWRPAAAAVHHGGGAEPLTGWRMKTGLDFAVHPRPSFPPFRVHSTLFNAMIAPLLNYRIRGVIWYQGESNVGRAQEYSELFPAMIADWRARWGERGMPFYYVQIAPWTYSNNGANPPSASLREAQLKAMSVPNTGMAVTWDITSDFNDIHPIDKQDVGWRLALWAFADTYHLRGIVCSGPLYRSMKRHGNRLLLTFDYVNGSLHVDGPALLGIQVAGGDRVFHPAQARVDNWKLLVWSDAVPHPVAVRYGWADYEPLNLFNGSGLPASPFRTDNWPDPGGSGTW